MISPKYTDYFKAALSHLVRLSLQRMQSALLMVGIVALLAGAATIAIAITARQSSAPTTAVTYSAKSGQVHTMQSASMQYDQATGQWVIDGDKLTAIVIGIIVMICGVGVLLARISTRQTLQDYNDRLTGPDPAELKITRIKAGEEEL